MDTQANQLLQIKPLPPVKSLTNLALRRLIEDVKEDIENYKPIIESYNGKGNSIERNNKQAHLNCLEAILNTCLKEQLKRNKGIV